ncbi:MAG: MMPL family transporter [Verrucomicrobia bacterium]|nr:MMPL family transporter [Verrucomicrobiota bacterium]
METPKPSLAARVLSWLATMVFERRGWFVWPQVALFVVCVGYTMARLEFNTNRSSLVGSDKRYHRNFLAYQKEFPAEDDLVTIVESTDQEKNRQFVERLGAKLEAETNLFNDVFYKGDLRMLGPKALMFLPQDTLEELRKTLSDYRPFITNFAQVTNLNALFRTVNLQFRGAAREENAETDAMLKSVPALKRIIDEAADALARPGMPPSPGLNALFGAGEEAEREMYITFAKGRIYLVTARAPSDDANRATIARLRQLVEETKREVPGVNVGITGEPVLELDEMAQSQKDTIKAAIVSLVLSVLVFIYGYNETGRPLKATLCLVIGLGYTMGFATLVIGHLNILTITFLPMLIGLAIDFGVHLISRYEEELRHGRSEFEAMQKAMVNTGMGIFTGAFTTAGAFLAMWFTDFRGIQEMGIISGAGLLICLVPMMTMLPVLLLRGRQNVIDHIAPPGDNPRARLERLWLGRPRIVIGIMVGLCALAAVKFGRVRFDYNLLNLQSHNLPAVVYEKKLLNSAAKSLLFGVVVTDSLTNAVALEKRLTNLATVAEVQSMGNYLAQNVDAKLPVIRQVKAEVSAVKFAVASAMLDVKDFDTTLEATKGYFGLALEEVQKSERKDLISQFSEMRVSIARLQQRIERGEPTAVTAKLVAFQRALLDDIRGTFEALRNQHSDSGMKVGDLPVALRNRYIGRTGKYLLQVFPKSDVWEREPQERFVQDLRSVDEDATGTPVQLYEYTTLLKKSYEQAAIYSLIAIALLVFIHFRSVVCVFLALLPVLVGALWGLGVMGWFGLPFNPANIMTLPLVVGIGVTNGIHILNRFAEERKPGILAKSTGKAVLVSALTTVAGFGSLILAEHQGIESLGWLMSIGTTTCMIAGLTCLPAILNLAMRWGWQINKKPSGADARTSLGPEEPR